MMFRIGVTRNPSHDAEITVISAEHLTINGRPIKNKAFATVSTGGCTDSKSYSTRVDEDGGHRPYWNDKFRMDLPWSLRGVLVEVHRRGSSGDRIIGMATIPVSDFTGEYCVPIPNHLHFLSYRLRDTKGARNGIINLSMRVMSPVAASSSSSSMAAQAPPTSLGFHVVTHPGTVTGFPVQHALMAVNHEEFKSRV